ALLINDWAVAAASELPLAEAVSAMEAAGEAYSPAGGFSLAAIGIVFAIGWAVMTLIHRVRARGESVVTWAGIVALGAPAYFSASFGNLNSVGDTFYSWNSAAAMKLASPLYIASAIALVVAVATPILLAATRISRARSVLPPD